LPGEGSQAILRVDEIYDFYINGILVVSYSSYQEPVPIDIAAYLVPGQSVFAVQAKNTRGGISGWREVLFDAHVSVDQLVVSVDIRPGSSSNPLNIKSKGVLPVAVLGAEELDVRPVDVDTIRLEGIASIRHAFDDIGSDGFEDLMLKFSTKAIVEVLGVVEDGERVELALAEQTAAGVDFQGADSVLILKKTKK